VEENTNPMPQGENNPTGNAFMHQQTALTTTLAARRNLNLDTDRFWIITNPSVKNALGGSVGYALIPGNNTTPHAQPNSKIRRMAGFINYHLWATPYNPAQMNATGLYPVLNNHINGLEQWVAQNNPIENTDLVVWYTMGLTHIPRPEEWPVMPLTEVSFKILPVGFFNRNPALDLP
jgi:primary-amine oxidase